MKILLEEKVLGTHSKKTQNIIGYWKLLQEKMKSRRDYRLFNQVLKRIYSGCKRRDSGKNKLREYFQLSLYSKRRRLFID
jgi:hypothetical protein